MEILRDEIVFDGDFIKVSKRYFRDLNGKERVWETVERKIFGNIVAIGAITPAREIILERIFRVPVSDWVIEFPAGLTDVEGELDEEAIRRELLEETGYQVQNLELLISGPPGAGTVQNEMSIYLGHGAKKIQEPRTDDSEKIEVIKIPTKDLVRYLLDSKTKVDLKVFSIIPFLMERNLL